MTRSVPDSEFEFSDQAMCFVHRSLAAEWGKYGMRFNAIAPGPIETKVNSQKVVSTGHCSDPLIPAFQTHLPVIGFSLSFSYRVPSVVWTPLVNSAKAYLTRSQLGG